LGVPNDDHADASRHYQFGDEVARGAMGRVVAAHDVRLDRPVVIKQLLRPTPALRARFAREARLTARLQHPSVVPIYEAGRDARGEPFYAMKRIEGPTLADALGAASSLADRVALLPALISVCEAIAHAHDRGVIHRDLKPANVIVGDLGETVVIDWGLAKEVGEAEPSVPGGLPVAHDPVATDEGALLGTPAYLAPELAAGSGQATAPTDVYALGAMLYAVLAGGPPYRGRHTMAVLAQIVLGPPPPLPSAIPPALNAIVQRAMARQPEDRPGARALAADLRRFQAGQLVQSHAYSSRELLARWAARHRGALMTALVASLLATASGLVGLGRIIEARNEAVQRRIAAEALVDGVVVDLRRELEPLGRLGLLDAIATSVRDYHDRLGTLASGASQQHRATALSLTGAVRRGEGDLEGALLAHRRALAVRAQLAAAGELEEAHALSQSHVDVARVLLELGRLEEARQASERAVEVADADADGTAAGLRSAAQARLQLGLVHSQAGRLKAAVQVLDAARQSVDGVASLELVRADVLLRLAEAHWQGGTFTQAEVHARAARALAQAAVSAEPRAPERVRLLAGAHVVLAHILVDRGDADAALVHIDAADQLFESAVRWDPSNARWQGSLVTVLALRAYIENTAGHPDEHILVSLKRVQATAEQLVALDPADPSARSQEILARTNLGYMKRKLAQLTSDPVAMESALQDVRASCIAAVSLAEEHPGDIGLSSRGSRCWLLLGEAHSENGTHEGAIAAYRRGIDALASVRIDEENPHKWHGDHFRLHLPLAASLHALGRLDEAEGYAREAIADMAQMDPSGFRDIDRTELLPKMESLAEAFGLVLPAGPPSL
jgi:tetratricopeptide (TPR) repeat protein